MWATGQRNHFHSQLPACLRSRKSKACQELLTLKEFWQEKLLHCSRIKGEHTLFPAPLSFPASFLGSLEAPLHLIHFKHLYQYNRFQQSQHDSFKLVLFFRNPTGIWLCSWQEAAAETKCLSCLHQQGYEEKETKKNPFNRPRPWLERAGQN